MSSLSEEFHQNMIVCLIQDLHNLHVYWDFDQFRIKTLGAFLFNLHLETRMKLCLCSHETRFAPARVEQEIMLNGLESGNYYFRNLDSDRVYHFELGTNNNGKFIIFARTPIISLRPSDDPSIFNAESIVLPLEFERDLLMLNSSWS